MTLKALQDDPAAFRSRLRIDCDGQVVELGRVLDEWQEHDFRALDGSWQRVVGQADPGLGRGWLERPRGHSKATDIAVMVSWVLFASRKPIRGVAAAADQDQARVLRDAIASLCKLNPWLGSLFAVTKDKVSNRHTGSELQIICSDAATSYGLLVDFIVCDELCHWKNRDLWDSLLSSAAKRANCLLLVISNAGFQADWQWKTREAIRLAPAWYFSRVEGPQATWITADRLDEQRRLLPDIAFRRLWLNVWSSGSGDALCEDDITQAITLDGPTFDAELGYVYSAGLDLGLSRDASALAIVGKHVGY